MKIAEIQTEPNWVLAIVAENGRMGRFDVKPYLEFEAFSHQYRPHGVLYPAHGLELLAGANCDYRNCPCLEFFR